jgi:hypothetical protein
MNNVNISNTTVNTTVVNNYYTNVVINKNVNVTNITYVNQRVPGAVAATSQQAFSSGQPVARNAVRVDPREVASAPVNALTPPAVPQRAAVLGGRPAANVKPSAAIQARAVVAKTAPPPPPPAFAQRQAAIQSNGGRPLSVAQVKQIAPVRAQMAAAPQVRVAPPAKPVEPRTMQTNKQVQPLNPNIANRPVSAAPAVNNTNRPAIQPAANNNPQRPPTAHPVDAQLEQQHQQQSLTLSKQQDQERQQVEQQQQKENQQLQKQKADEAKQQQIQQQHQQELEALQQKHQQQQQQLQAKQEEEHRKAEKAPPPPPKAKPAPKPKDDKPH